jgi:CheY-like chemotaxis protein
VLVVDDNQVIRTVVVAMLAHMGADCDVAGSGFDAIQAARQTPYQLVLMDLKMPGLDGPGAARAILAYPGDRPRIHQ